MMMIIFLNWVYPNSWMVYVMKNPHLKWMMARGTPKETSSWPVDLPLEKV